MNTNVKIAVGVVGSLVVLYFFPTFLWWGLLFGGGYFTKALMGPTDLDKMMGSGEEYNKIEN